MLVTIWFRIICLASNQKIKTHETVIVSLCMNVKIRPVTFREEHKLRDFLDEVAKENIQT